MSVYVPAIVYKNLVRLIGYRGGVLEGAPLTDTELSQKLNHFGLVQIIGRRSADGPSPDPRGSSTIVIVLFAPGSKYAGKSADFKKMLKGLPKPAPGTNLEILFVSEAEFSRHVKKQAAAYRAGDPSMVISDHSYEKFLIEVPRHVLVPRHVIAPEAEVAEFCRSHYTDKANFPKILASDTMAVWLGLKPGMVVKIYRVSETAGTSVVYRLCVRG